MKLSFSNPAPNSIWIRTRISRIFFLVLFFGLFFGVSSVSQVARAGESSAGNNFQIEWESSAPGHVVKVVNEEPAKISFRVRTGEKVSRIKFEISRKDRLIGITISPVEVAVHDGSAGSVAEFNIPRGMPLGKHNLTIRVLEIGTDRVIGTGILPFILLPSGLDCMC